MHHARQAGYRFDGSAFQGRRLFYVIFAYIGAFVLIGIIASQGPSVWTIKTSSRVASPLVATTHINFVAGVSPTKQLLVFMEELMNPDINKNLNFVQTHNISLYGSYGGKGGGWPGCDYGCSDCTTDTYCHTIIEGTVKNKEIECKSGYAYCSISEIAVVDFLDYNDYFFKVDVFPVAELEDFASIKLQYSLGYVNPSYTFWEMPWKYAFLFGTLLILFTPYLGLLHRLCLTRMRPSPQQNSAVLLLFLLVLFNDPLVAAQIYVNGAGSSLLTLHAFCQAVFLGALLYHWLSLFSMAAREGLGNGGSTGQNLESNGYKKRSSIQKFIGCSRLATVFVIFISSALVFMYLRLKQGSDFTFSPDDVPYSEGLQILFYVSVSVYIVWMVVVLAKGICMYGSAARPYKFLLAAAFLSMVFMVCGMLAGVMAPLRMNAGIWLTWQAIPNVYVWLLGYGYAPDQSAPTKSEILQTTELVFANEWPQRGTVA